MICPGCRKPVLSSGHAVLVMRQGLEMLAHGQDGSRLRETSVELAELLSKCVSDYADKCDCTLGARIAYAHDQALDVDVAELDEHSCRTCGFVGTIGESGRVFCLSCGAERDDA